MLAGIFNSFNCFSMFNRALPIQKKLWNNLQRNYFQKKKKFCCIKNKT